MAFGTLQRPVLVAPGPVQRIRVVDLLARLQMEPALAALILRPRIPGDRQRLVTSAGEGDQVLLQRVDAEGVGDLVVGELAVGAVGADHELVAAFEEAGFDALVPEPGVGEIAEDGRSRRPLHGEIVMRPRPRLEFTFMAGLADLGADVTGGFARFFGVERGSRQN